MRCALFALLVAAGLLASCPVPAGDVEPQSSAAPRGTTRTIYSCIEGGLTVLADRPCANGATSEQLRTLRSPPGHGGGTSTTPAAPSARVLPRRLPAPPAAARDAGGDEERRATCRQLQDRLDALDSRMRQGYRAREAGRLWEQRRALKHSFRAARC